MSTPQAPTRPAPLRLTDRAWALIGGLMLAAVACLPTLETLWS